MNIQLNYGTAVATIPASALAVMDRANIKDLKVLLTICSDASILAKNSFSECIEVLVASTGLSRNDIEFSLSFWRGTGVILFTENEIIEKNDETEPTTYPRKDCMGQTDNDDSSKKQESEKESKEKKHRVVRPIYSEHELGDWLEKHHENKVFLDECQNVWKDMFNTSDHKMLMELVDYLKYDWDYVFILLAYCERHFRAQENIGKSMNYVIKQGYVFYDKGIRTVTSLQNEIIRLEKVAANEHELRKLFGIENGELIPKHERLFSKWLNEYGFGVEMIRIAREKAVDQTGTSDITAHMNYANRILQNWDKNDVRTPQDVELEDIRYTNEKEDKRKKKKNQNKPVNDDQGSFNTDDFFAAAVRRSFGDDFDPDKQGT